MSETCLKRP